MTQGKTPHTIRVHKRFPIIITDLVPNKEKEYVLGPPSSEVTTGIERDEEKKHCLQKATQSQNSTLLDDSVTSTNIPIPKVEALDSKAVTYYNELCRKKLILNHDIKHELDDSCSYVMREDVYALDEEDASWLLATAVQKQVTITKEELESTMEALGNAPKKKSLAAFLRTQSKLDVKKRTLIYDYWREKRRRVHSVLPSASLMPVVPNKDVNDDKDPYVAFRKRDVVVQVTRRRSASIPNLSTVTEQM